jgi:hypothetical protein
MQSRNQSRMTDLWPDSRRVGCRNRAGVSVIVTVAFWLANLSLAFAASASADGPGEAENARHQYVATDEYSGTDAERGPHTGVHPPELPPGEEPPPPPDPSTWPTRDERSVSWRWPEFEPGHDKCKRRRGYPLPIWCFGLSNWPVLKARAVTARVTGIREGSMHPPKRRKHGASIASVVIRTAPSRSTRSDRD